MSVNIRKIFRSSVPFIMPALIFFCWNAFPVFRIADSGWRDLLYIIRGSEKSRIEDVIIVAIDELSFQQIKLRWPWPRTLHAELLDNLREAGALAVVFDILFPEKSVNPAEDTAFADSIRAAGNVVLASNITITGREGYETYFIEAPVPELAGAAASVGLVNFYPDEDGNVRMASNDIDGRETIASAAVTVARSNKTHSQAHMQYPGQSDERSAGKALLTSSAPDDESMFFIDYAGKAGTIPTVSYYQVINRMLAPEIFRNRIVFVGFVTDSSVEVQNGADSYPFPFMRFTKKMMAGVEIQANVARTIIKNYPVKAMPFEMLKWLLFYLSALILISMRKHPIYLTLSTAGFILINAALSILVFTMNGTILDIAPSITATSVNGIVLGTDEFIRNYREKSMLRKAFSSYVSPDVVATVISDHRNLKLGGEKKRLTVLFSDIRGFTSLSERLTPEYLVGFLNDYFTRMTDVVFRYGGTLDKYIGDAIMVIFGAPVWSDSHAEKACLTALGMKESLRLMNIEMSASSDAGYRSDVPSQLNIQTGIGINTGEMIVGNMGSLRRFDYTAIGDEVNLASRLEGVTKFYNVQIIVSEETKKSINQDKFLCMELDLIRVKGKQSAIRIFELISLKPSRKVDERYVEIFSLGLLRYREMRWEEAKSLFALASEKRGTPGPSEVFMERCDMFMTDPPVKSDQLWDGVWVMSSK